MKLATLDEILALSESKTNRLTRLLKDPLKNSPADWHLHVPPASNDALDLKQTDRIVNGKSVLTWTQGNTFAFAAGDALFDSPDAYQRWDLALKKINLCVQVTKSIPASPKGDKESRFPGSVEIEIYEPNEERTNVVRVASKKMTQDDFVRYIIEGPTLL